LANDTQQACILVAMAWSSSVGLGSFTYAVGRLSVSNTKGISDAWMAPPGLVGRSWVRM